jgi:hypothetical protein
VVLSGHDGCKVHHKRDGEGLGREGSEEEVAF